MCISALMAERFDLCGVGVGGGVVAVAWSRREGACWQALAQRSDGKLCNDGRLLQ